RISRLIVKNTDNKPVGIISFRDLFEISLQLGSEEDVTESAALSGAVRTGFLSEEGFGGVSLAKDVMTPNIISIKPDEDLAVASKIMLENGV
ncbi:MAG: CBS domain-containing protein, partial [Nitrosopumilaceae archaeon]|nr:CBS domain-containing protein [Nitrosopumilaceae archaeon]NIU85793.1 CBS domain-containing protein [Nitrosopumilaceae archaeon]NIV64652.1 CBS domain-containing protein [Nitrosopumilaceae archaeon]NIX60039.1 CBS domain-containing protein [Nitrosopumilaceae archaeon]